MIMSNLTSSAWGFLASEGSDNVTVDQLTGAQTTVHLLGGNDVAEGDNRNNWFNGNQGNDLIKAFQGEDTVFGGKGNDTLDGGTGSDEMYGNIGNDNLSGGDGNDTIYGGKDNDTVHGGEGSDILWGDRGNDVLIGGEAPDTLNGGDGDDFLLPGKTWGRGDVLNGGEGYNVGFTTNFGPVEANNIDILVIGQNITDDVFVTGSNIGYIVTDSFFTYNEDGSITLAADTSLNHGAPRDVVVGSSVADRVLYDPALVAEMNSLAVQNGWF
jgi:Ca2+-binding RTX toxin-like protein